jgi:hypothetical protein
MLLGAIVKGWPCAVIEGNSTKLVCPLSKRETGVLDTAGGGVLETVAIPLTAVDQSSKKHQCLGDLRQCLDGARLSTDVEVRVLSISTLSGYPDSASNGSTTSAIEPVLHLSQICTHY